ncbi:Putative SAM-dependent DNA methylase, adenine-specific [Desulfonema limicola]|uniref:SAM-dependent DNA methylase, adenine-specific n=1 Tax=Desulfonema limicola TaxID=45656 RepID=A0A975B575_9BACT|nr:Putative SAM-dependent DNA methylase, adenine-specific [Desulfonema limicola]
MSKTPKRYNKYIEAFFGGGALFFALEPDKAIISESNPELVNLYNTVSNNMDFHSDNLGINFLQF